MKITEIKWERGKQYKVKNSIYTVSSLESNLHDSNDRTLNKFYSIREISELDFEEVKQLTENEKLLYSLLPQKYQWVTKDKNAELFICTHKPTKGRGSWLVDQGEMSEFPFDNIVNLSWEDEPLYIGGIERR